MSIILDPKLDDEIIVGEQYLRLMATMGLDPELSESQNYEEESTLDEDTTPRQQSIAVLPELVAVERAKAEELIEQLKLSNYLVEEWVDDPESEDGGFLTLRYPRIGDIVRVPRDFKIDWESVEPCEVRDQSEDWTNCPDTDPWAEIGWSESPRQFKMTLWDVLEHKIPVETQQPRTLAGLSWMKSFDTITGREEDMDKAPIDPLNQGTLQFSYELRNLAREHSLSPLQMLIAIAKDSRRYKYTWSMSHGPKYDLFGNIVPASVSRRTVTGGTFKPWQYRWACQQVYLTLEIPYNQIKENGLWWIEDVRKQVYDE